MKKYVVLSLVIVTTLTLSGCGSKVATKKNTDLTGNLQKIVGDLNAINTDSSTGGREASDLGKRALSELRKNTEPKAPTVPERKAVDITRTGFVTALTTIKTGGTITWTNRDKVAHTVTDKKGEFSGSVAPGATYSYTFDKQGVYAYKCTLHPSMEGIVIVSDK